MATNVGQLFVSLGFDVDSKGLQQFDKDMASLSRNSLAVLATVGITGYGLKKFVQDATEGAQQMRSLSFETNIAAAELAKYAAVAHYTSGGLIGSDSQAAKAIADLDVKIQRIKHGLYQPNAFEAPYLTGADNALDVITKMQNALRGASTAEQSLQLSNIGLGPGFIGLLNTTPDKFNEIADKVSLSKDELNELAKAATDLDKIFQEIYVDLEKIFARNFPMWIENAVKSVQSLKEAYDFIKSPDEEKLGKLKTSLEDKKNPFHWITTVGQDITSAMHVADNRQNEIYNLHHPGKGHVNKYTPDGRDLNPAWLEKDTQDIFKKSEENRVEQLMTPSMVNSNNSYNIIVNTSGKASEVVEDMTNWKNIRTNSSINTGGVN